MMTARQKPSAYPTEEVAILVRNLAALWATDPRLAAAVEAADPPGGEPVESWPGHRVERSKSGLPTVVVRSAEGKEIYLHSRYQPAEEARRLLKGLGFDSCAAFYVLGFGLGYHVEALFEEASDEAIIVVFEPDVRLLRVALGQRDLTRLLASRRILFFWREDKSELLQRLTPHGALVSTGFEPLSHAPSIQVNPRFFAQAQQWIAEYAAFTRTSIQTLVLNGRKTAENIAANIGWYVATPNLARLKDAHKGEPAIIVSAGPSLRKNKHLLAEAAGRAVIVAVQTTLQPLVEMGIEPQYVTSLDYHEICTRFFEKLPPTITTELVAEPKATDLIFGLHPGPLSLLGNDFAESLLREMKLGKAGLPAGATVAHLAFYLAEHLGCDPIIFIGQDLGFSDGLCYAPGTSYEDVWRPELGRFCTVEMKQWEQIVRERPILRRIPDWQGNPMYTEERLFTYLQQFERDFARSSARIIDATEGGAAKRGARMMTLGAALEEFCRTPLKTARPPHPGPRWDRLDECRASLACRLAEAREIEDIGRHTLPLLVEARDHLSDQGRVNRVIARIDVLRKRMNEYGACYDLIMQLTQASELKRFRSDRAIAAGGSRGNAMDRQRRQVQRDIENVRSVIDAAGEFQTMIEQVIGRLRRPREREAAA